MPVKRGYRAGCHGIWCLQQERFEGWHNLLIYADKIQAMRHVLGQKDMYRKVRLVYIDPPFATNEVFTYRADRASTISRPRSGRIACWDRLNGDLYLRFLQQLLTLPQELLADNGFIDVQMDYKIGHYVRLLLGEVFGRNRFINATNRIECNPRNFDHRASGKTKDVIHFISKAEDYFLNGREKSLTDEAIVRLSPTVESQGRRYTTALLQAAGKAKKEPTGRPWHGLLLSPDRHWRYAPRVSDEVQAAKWVEWSTCGNPRRIMHGDEWHLQGKNCQDVWVFKAPTSLCHFTEKSLDSQKTIAAASSNPGDSMLDCLAGSGTAPVPWETLGRHWVGDDDPPTAIYVAWQRLLDRSGVKPLSIFELSPGAATQEHGER